MALHRVGKLMQNGFVKPFNGRTRDELLNESLFFGLDHARQKLTTWMTDYNTRRPILRSATRPLRPTPRN
ncbi:MAG: transposase, family [Rhodospirillales bacterium]|nr:transposase, family [Rhodospirillales bacterium]